MKRLSLLLLLLLTVFPALRAQDYEVPEVVISTEKAKLSGKMFYVHTVLPKQTVFSICKAYGVTKEELAAVNPDMKDGLKAGSILLIPMSEAAVKAEEARQQQARQNAGRQEETGGGQQTEESGETDGPAVERVIEHRVRWYESIGSIARKYGLTSAEILSYNGLSDSDSIRGKTLLIPVMGEAGSGAVTAVVPDKPADSGTEVTPTEPEDPMTPVRKVRWFSSREPLHIALVLPFNIVGNNASASFMNFYSGALLAIEDQKEKGAHLVVNVYDLSKGADAILGDPKFEDCELVIGPVEAATLDPFLRESDRKGTILVSPLDHKADSLVDVHPFFFQVPPSTEVQLENLVGTLRRNHGPVVLASSSSTGESALVARIEDLLQTEGLPYRKASLSDLPSLAATGTHNAPAQVIIGSENKHFATEAIRTLNSMRKRNIPLEVWCTNRVRNMDTSDPDALFNVSLHTSVPYFVDYSNETGRDFVRRYRALYFAEPDDFAFQGYDVLTYFIASLMKQGTAFTDHADLHSMQLLHCNFQFERIHEKSGWRNRATRNLFYDKDEFAIQLAK